MTSKLGCDKLTTSKLTRDILMASQLGCDISKSKESNGIESID